MSILFIVVIYNNNFNTSLTLTSISKYSIEKNFKLCIWNNGPKSLIDSFSHNSVINELRQSDIEVELYEDLSNAPLSIIYNKLIDDNLNSDYFVIFDDDTEISQDYINMINNIPSMTDLVLPHIENIHTNKIIAPTDNGKVINKNGEISLNKPGSVSSGLVLSNRLISIVKSYYKDTVFDENFALYGIDSTFLMRIRKIAKKESIKAICEGYLKHSLSLSITENKSIKSFRDMELAYDKILTLRHYPSFGKLKTFIKVLNKIKKKDSQLKMKDALLCLYKGKHPRCISYEEGKHIIKK